ncbi:hypothetical protein ACTFIY_004798 [Dictyostelium cf. discoideum]
MKYILLYESHNDFLVTKYNNSKINASYYKNISFIWDDKSSYDMSFDCVLNGSIRICTLPVKESDHEQMYSEKLVACTEKNGVLDTCDYNIDLCCFPSPLVISPFRPKTRGGNTTLSGYYLEIKERVWIQYEMKVHPGCGLRTIIWENRQTYNFTYQDPNIEIIDIIESGLDITGTNFYNQSIFVSVKIDNNIINPNDIISVDFENIKLKFNYSDPFSSKLNIQVACCDYWSNKFQITYPPIPSSVNSIPKLKGGLLIINGNRLTSSPSSNNINISITVGDSICSIISTSSNEIKLNDEIHIIGSCLGNINSTHIQINGKQVLNQKKSINNDETVLILKVQNQIYNFNISIESNSIKSNDINVDVTLYVKINEIPSVGNKLINFTLLYCSIIYQSLFSYESPLIDKCNLNSNEIVTCIGNGFVNSNETTIIISNQSITLNNESKNNNDKSISFQMNEEYIILGELYLNVCSLLSNKVIINTIPIFKNVSIPNLFDTNGGNIVIIGKYLNNNTNITIECNNEVEKECKLNNSTSLECNIESNGPNDKTCKLLFNNDDNNNNIESTFNIIYKSPSINQTRGILTIIGNDFYYPIDKVIIIGNDNGNGSDNLNCNEPGYINDTMITCFIQATNYTFNNIKNGEMIFINVTTNGKSGISKVFKYLTQSDDSHQYSDARNIFQNLLLSILIILIISLLFISNI